MTLDDQLEDAWVNVRLRPEHLRGTDVKPLPPRLWEAARIRLQERYRDATNNPVATLIAVDNPELPASPASPPSELVERARGSVAYLDSKAELISNTGKPRSDNDYGRAAQLISDLADAIASLERVTVRTYEQGIKDAARVAEDQSKRWPQPPDEPNALTSNGAIAYGRRQGAKEAAAAIRALAPVQP